jgi:hypothetical protein
VAISLVQKSTLDAESNGTSTSSSFSAGFTLGNLIVVHAWGSPGPATGNDITCTDGSGNTYTLRLYQTTGPGAAIWLAIWTAPVTQDGVSPDTVVVHYSTGSNTLVSIAEEWTGQASSPIGNSSSNSGINSVMTPGSMAVSAGSLVTTAVSYFTPGNPTQPAGYTVLGEDTGTSAGIEDGAVAYAIGPASPVSAGWTVMYMLAPVTTQYVAGQLEILAASSTPAPTPPLLYPHNQRIDMAVDTWQEWDAFRQRPYSQFYVPTEPPKRVMNYRPVELDETSSVPYRQIGRHVLPPTYIPTPPPTRQAGQQLSYELPDYQQQWESYRPLPVVTWYVPLPPPTKRPSSQLSYELPDFNDVWYKHYATQPVPVTYTPTPPSTRQSPQRWDEAPDVNYVWFKHYAKYPLPSLVQTMQEGLYGVQNTIFMERQAGQYRVANNIAGYNVWVGAGTLPDLTGEPTAFSATLPVSIPLTPPVSGTETFYVLVTVQDVYGLNSQNQYYQTVTINSSGSPMLGPISAPQDLMLVPQAGGMLKVMATYTGVSTDEDAANQWKVWVGTSLPLVTYTPAAVVAVNGSVLYTAIGPYAPGLYYVLVALYRTADGHLSSGVVGTVTISTVPVEVTAVPGGYQQP